MLECGNNDNSSDFSSSDDMPDFIKNNPAFNDSYDDSDEEQ